MDKQWICIPKNQLPPAVARWINPSVPLPEQQRYDPIPHIYRNLAQMASGLAFVVGLLTLLLSLVKQNGGTLTACFTLIGGGLGLGWTIFTGRRHQKCGGDYLRRGIFVLPEGLLIVRGKSEAIVYDFLPREQVTGFSWDPAEPEQACTIGIQTTRGPFPAYGFPSAGALIEHHSTLLEQWRLHGDFSWFDFKHAPATK